MSVYRDLKYTRPIIDCKEDKEIVSIFEKPTVVYPEKGNLDLFFTSNEVAIKGRVDRQKYIKSFAKDVGILNIAMKLAKQGENIFDGRFAVKGESYVDLRGMPRNGEELSKLMADKDKVWANLDPELKKSMSYEEFVKSFTGDEFLKYLQAKVAAKTTKAEEKVKEGE